MKIFLFVLFCISQIYSMENEIEKSLTISELNRAFIKAVECANENPSPENFEKIENYLHQGANINTRIDSLGKTAIIQAVQNSNKNLFDFLLKKGADINFCDYLKTTPLYIVITKNLACFNIEDDFLKCGANVNTIKEGTLLHSAIRHGTIDSIKLLIKYRAKINKKDFYEITPLNQAINYRAEAIEEVCNQGASLINVDNYNSNAFHAAIQKKLPKNYINLLITNARFDSYDEEIDKQLEKKVIIAYWALKKSNIFHSDVQKIILSHLAMDYLYGFNKKFCRWLVKIDNKDAKNPLLNYTNRHVNHLKLVLESTDSNNKTALQLLHKKHRGDAYIHEVESLVDVKKLRKDQIEFMNGSVQEDNLVVQIYEHSKKLLES